MAATARQPKPPRKGGPSDAPGTRRQNVWSSGGRASPAYSSNPNTGGSNNNRTAQSPQGGFPPLSAGSPGAPTNGTRTPDQHDRVLQALSGLTGTTITLVTKTSQRYEGVIASTNGEGDTTGVTLKDVKEVANPSAPPKDKLFIASTNIDTWTSGPADAKFNGESFKTDTDISKTGPPRRERELQAWTPDTTTTANGTSSSPPPPSTIPSAAIDDITFGPGAAGGGGSWDQFAVNEKLFGVRTNFDEEVYTTRLDRTGPDFKEKERRAAEIANEIIGSTTNNPHLAEERNQIQFDGMNEEDKYGAVVRGANAYVPPGARKQPPGAPTQPKADVPKVAVNAPDGSQAVASAVSTPSTKSPSPAPTGSSAATKPPADPLPAFRQFVTTEKQRLTQKRQALVKNEMDKRMAELLKFSQSFKLNKPIPEDLVTILAKDEEKQRQIREKSAKDAASAQARTIGSTSTSGLPTSNSGRIAQANATPATNRTALKPPATAAIKATPGASSPGGGAAAAAKPSPTTKADSNKPARISMYIQPIPAFKGKRSSTGSGGGGGGQGQGQNGPAPANANQSGGGATVSGGGGAAPTSPNNAAAAAARLNVNASSFKPNPKAVVFTPTTNSPNPSVSPASPKAKSGESTPAATPNPFFGTRPIKKGPSASIRDDFNPYKYNKVAEASAVSAIWPYNGKRYMHMYPPIPAPPQQQSPHLPPPVPQPMAPPPYEEAADAASRAAAGGYVYAYPPYGYPQHMMPGMAPPPPGAYMPPFMQPMPYPPGMPPPNAMYASPSMGQMPPPQAYMPPPPPGSYPAPNGAGPRPSMPPTPIPAHAHPYYHQSPQMQHAVPYPMFSPAPVPPHPYETPQAPPVPMGHA